MPSGTHLASMMLLTNKVSTFTVVELKQSSYRALMLRFSANSGTSAVEAKHV